MNEIVSVVTPCYNSEKYIEAYLRSLLEQTYSALEIILVDDGSTDRTAEIIQSYRPAFEAKGILLYYLYQEHENQAAAVNRGLKKATGEYLIWPDSDDVLEPESINLRVEYLRGHPDYGMVRSDRYYIDDETGARYEGKPYRHKGKTDVFWDLFFEKLYISCGCYMIRMEMFDQINPSREIIIGSGGQNYQMLLPMAYYYRCGEIPQKLYGIVRHEDSHSNLKRSYQQALSRMDSLLEICRGILDSLPMDDKDRKTMMRIKENQCYGVVDKRHGRQGKRLLRKVRELWYRFRYCNMETVIRRGKSLEREQTIREK